MKTGSSRWMFVVAITFLSLATLTACSEGNRESDENVGAVEQPEPEATATAGSEPEMEDPDAVEGAEPEAEEAAEPTTNEIAASVGELGAETGKQDEVMEAAEPGEYIGSRETWDERVGSAQLVLAYDEDAGAFNGTVRNVTRGGICEVQVWVRLSTGTELGPTASANVPANQTIEISIPAGSESFQGWNARIGMTRCAP